MRRRKNKIHNYILKAITTIAAIAFMLSAAALDSESMLPAYICIACIAWIVPFAAINGR